MQGTTQSEARRALVDLLAAIEGAPVGWSPPGILTAERLEAGRAWLEELRRAVGRAVARLEDPARVRTYVFATAARLRSRREDLDRDVSRTAAAAPPGESDGAPWMHYGERRVQRALRAVPFAVNGVEAAAREALDALGREEQAQERPAAAGGEEPPAPADPAGGARPRGTLEDRIVAFCLGDRRPDMPARWSDRDLADALGETPSTVGRTMRRALARDLDVSVDATADDLRAALTRDGQRRLSTLGSLAKQHLEAAAARPRPDRKRQAEPARKRDDATRATVERWSESDARGE